MKPTCKGGQQPASVRAWRFPFRAHCALLFLVLLAAACSNVFAQEAQYLTIYEKIGQADSLEAAGKTAAALAKYLEAQGALAELHRKDPSWNRDMVTYRLNYLAEKAAACQAKLNAAEAGARSGTNTPNATTGAASDRPRADALSQSKEPTFKLLAQGSEPRKVLRFQPKAGDTQTVAFTMKMALEPGPLTNFPPITQTVQVTSKNVSANGDVEYEMVISDVSVQDLPDTPPQFLEGLKEAFSYAKGVTTSGLISSRGFSKKTETTNLKSDQRPAAIARLFQAQMTRGLDIVAAPLPEEPVGAGGRWEIERDSGDAVEKTTYEILSLDENRVTAKATITVSPGKQKTAGPGMTGGGNGEITLNLARIMPQNGSLLYTLTGTDTGGSQQQRFNMKIRMDLSIETK